MSNIIQLRPEARIDAPMWYYDPDGTGWVHHSQVSPYLNVNMRRYRIGNTEGVCVSIDTKPPKTEGLYWGPLMENVPPALFKPTLWARIKRRLTILPHIIWPALGLVALVALYWIEGGENE